MTKPTKRVDPAQKQREACLAEYIHTAREGLTTGHGWSEHWWRGVGIFSKFGTHRRRHITPLDPSFVDFAKAYMCHRHSENPSLTKSAAALRLTALRLLEAALLQVHGSANPLLIDLQTLTAAVDLATSSLSGQGPGKAGRELEFIARYLVSRGILPPYVDHWMSPVGTRALLSIRVGSEADKHRASKLPDMEAIAALAEIFNRKLDPQDERVHCDIYVTSVATLLCSAPSRGQEVHGLPVDVVFRATDRFGSEQMGLRWEGSKGFGSFVKWVWSEMVESVELAIERVRAITEEGRRLARHYEDPKSRDKFYRHANCPGVGDHEPLSAMQACQALGFASVGALRVLRSFRRKRTLRSLEFSR